VLLTTYPLISSYTHNGDDTLQSVLRVMCGQVEVSASGWSLINRSPIECNREASIQRKPWSTRNCCAAECAV